jgi:transposase
VLIVADIYSIRSLRARGWSERRIAQELGLARKTVKKYAEAEEAQPRYRQRKARRKPAIEPVRGLIDQWLAEDKQAPPKQRHTAQRIWERLTSPPYNYRIAASTVRLYVHQARPRPVEAFVPLAFGFGHAQADWGAAEVVVAGVRQDAIFFVLRLDTSEDAFVQIFPTQRTEAVYEGHARAFAHFEGAPPTILYDNAPTLVAHVLRGRDREETAGFLALRAHYGFAADFCQPGLKGAHEKGGVENGIGWARRNLLVPVPQAESWDALNEELAARCRARRGKAHSREAATVGEVRAQEQAHLLPLPRAPFACCQIAVATVNRYAMVSYDRNRYSAPAALVGRSVTLKAFVDRIEVVDGAHIVAAHPRSYERDREVLAVEHYVELLERKPGAVAHGRIFGHLEEPYARLRTWCLAQTPPATREFVAVLRLWEDFGRATVTAALVQAQAVGVYRVAAVRQLCLRARPENAAPAPLDAAWVPVVAMDAPDLRQFDQLLKGGTA